mmetsp:Transcript_29278/g.68579  ORF Transcript_29278/g.68579 Transcript_29278/m.68579 type:complete len:289 (+) Transcript_29278:612-1478(+)
MLLLGHPGHGSLDSEIVIHTGIHDIVAHCVVGLLVWEHPKRSPHEGELADVIGSNPGAHSIYIAQAVHHVVLDHGHAIHVHATHGSIVPGRGRQRAWSGASGGGGCGEEIGLGHGGHGVEIGLVPLGHGSLLLTLGQPAHNPTEVGTAPEEDLVVVRSSVRSRRNTTEGPGIDQPVEGVVVAVIEVQGHDEGLEVMVLEDLPRPAVGHPANNVRPLVPAQDALELGREFLQPHGMSVLDGTQGRGRVVPVDRPGPAALSSRRRRIGRVGVIPVKTLGVGDAGVVPVLV